MSQPGIIPSPVADLLTRFRRAFRAFEQERDEDHEGGSYKAHWSFTIRTEVDEIDGGVTAWIEELPGCISDGDTEDEALENLAEAFRGVIAVRLDDSQPHIETSDDDRKITTRQLAFG